MKTVVALIYDECELRRADMLNIGQLDDGTYSGLVESVGLDGGIDIAPRVSKSELRKTGLSTAVKQDLRWGFSTNN